MAVARVWLCLLLFAVISGSFPSVIRNVTSSAARTATTTTNMSPKAESKLTCWHNIVSFFVVNYLAHAATVISFPDEPVKIVMLNMVLAILLPATGAMRGLIAIFRHGIFVRDPIKQALRAQALCMVVRTEKWRPIQEKPSYVCVKMKTPHSLTHKIGWIRLMPNFVIHGFLLVPKDRQVHGFCDLPEGYDLAYVPETAQVESLETLPYLPPKEFLPIDSERMSGKSSTPSEVGTVGSALCEISPNYYPFYSFSSALVAIIQIIYASTTLYESSRGKQLAKYGYAAFSLTVVPYLLMSFINLVGNLVHPRYSALYLVKTDIMEEASHRGGRFHSVAGKLNLEKRCLSCRNTLDYSTDHNTLIIQCCSSYQRFDRHLLCKPRTSTSMSSELLFVPIRYLSRFFGRVLCLDGAEKNTEYYASAFVNSWIRAFKHISPFDIALAVICVCPIAVIGAISRFDPASSSLPQRAWTMSWVAAGTVCTWSPRLSRVIYGRIEALASKPGKGITKTALEAFKKSTFAFKVLIILDIVFPVLFIIPAIGGFIIVARMYDDYDCKLAVD
ncbi:hypothetical protein Egran_02308 [Elaphomyces granulatus]|uniref:Uncharacterized protein n=1 Tax=Elaphomyces granulatus TaxID=519963 RepID=A0A232M0K6_9EURO|nr:hypothetical protein Egran_02308 [Elaphomyces granulatus]